MAGPWSKSSPDQVWDTVVVGSGMGGMIAAAMLAEVGQEVLVLEQHFVPGGFTHMFRRKQWRWDVGVHAVGEVTDASFVGRLLARLTEHRLKWASLGPVYDTFAWPEGFEIGFPDRPEQFRASLVAAFPAEGAAIDEYLAINREIARAMRQYYLSRILPMGVHRACDWLLARKAQPWLEARTREVMAALTSNHKLRSVLVAQWPYYGAPPSRSAFAMHALVARHFLWGGYYPVGGARSIAHELLTKVASSGGWTRVGADVSEILVENGRVRGVRLSDGEVIRAKQVVSAVGARATVERLLPKELRVEDWAQEIASLPPGPAHVCLYLGFQGDIRSAGAGSSNRWFYETWDSEAETWAVKAASPLPRAPVLYVSFPSLKDPSHDAGPEQLHTGEVVTFVPWEAFGAWRKQPWRARDAAYAELKERMKEQLLAQLFERLPGLKQHLVFSELSTPLSTDHFARPVHGSIYGLEPTPARFRADGLRPRSPIPGLFFAGSDIATAGVVGALIGGFLAASAIDPKRILLLMAKLR